MLGPVVMHADERALLLANFLAAAPGLGACMLTPMLYLLSRATAQLDATPPVDLALMSGAPP